MSSSRLQSQRGTSLLVYEGRGASGPSCSSGRTAAGVVRAHPQGQLRRQQQSRDDPPVRSEGPAARAVEWDAAQGLAVPVSSEA